MAAGFFPVNHGSKIKVRRALSNDGGGDQVASRHPLIDRAIGWIKFVSRPILLSIRNTFRRKGRLALTMFTLTVAGAQFSFLSTTYNPPSTILWIKLVSTLWPISPSPSINPIASKRWNNPSLQIPGVIDSEAWLAGNAEVIGENDKVETDIALIAPPAESELARTRDDFGALDGTG